MNTQSVGSSTRNIVVLVQQLLLLISICICLTSSKSCSAFVTSNRKHTCNKNNLNYCGGSIRPSLLKIKTVLLPLSSRCCRETHHQRQQQQQPLFFRTSKNNIDHNDVTDRTSIVVTKSVSATITTTNKKTPQYLLLSSTDDNNEKENNKVPFYFDPNTKGGVIVLMMGLFLLTYIIYAATIQIFNMSEIDAGIQIGMGFTVFSTLAWMSTYLFRVATKDMTYAKQLKDYENAVIAKRLEELDDDEIQALVEEVSAKDTF